MTKLILDINTLQTARDAAVVWGVSFRRAYAHLRKMREKHGIGIQIGRSWVYTLDDIIAHTPNQKYCRTYAEEPKKDG